MDMTTKCVLCGKAQGAHKAGTGHCPIGKKHRADTYSYATSDRFLPTLPLLPKDVLKIVEAFREAARDGKNYVDREYALYKLLNDLTEDRKTLERVRGVLADSPDTRKTFTL